MTLLADILGRTVELTIDDFGWRGEGFARVDDGWVSVPGALPGERVLAHVGPEIGRGQRVFAQLVDVLDESERRGDSHCERVATCRGCQLRHATAGAERDFKIRRIQELLEKHAAIEARDVQIVGSANARDRGYRWRASLTYRADGPELGLVAGPAGKIVPMGDCPSLTADCRAAIRAVQEVVLNWAGPWPDAEDGRALRGIDVWASAPIWINLRPQSKSTRSQEHFAPLIDAIGAALPGAIVGIRPADDAWVQLPYKARGHRLVARPGAWVHATVEPAEALYEQVAAWSSQTTGEHLDVGCGVGGVSVAVSSVDRPSTGVDRNLFATESAARNAEQLDAPISVISADWEKATRDLALAGAQFSSGSLNPMREPIGERTLAYVDKLVTERLLVLGPSPEAGSKEVGALVALGWGVERVWCVDLHPASYQVMMGVELIRRPA